MINYKTYKQPADYVAQAKYQLILARFWKQEAEKERFLSKGLGFYAYKSRLAASQYEHYAKMHRLRARDFLVLHEEVIGTFFMLGIRKASLKETLSGKGYRDWVEYHKKFAPRGRRGEDIWS